MSALKQVRLYTDGACLGNPGPGGYGLILQYGNHRRELSGGFRRTTNNRMEIMAVIKGLEALKEKCAVRLFSDSEYVVNSITKGWASRWKARNWRRKQQIVPNWDLWHLLLKLADLQDLRAEWVKGHVGHPENERCDEIARLAASTHLLPLDAGFENPPSPR